MHAIGRSVLIELKKIAINDKTVTAIFGHPIPRTEREIGAMLEAMRAKKSKSTTTEEA